MKYKITGDEPAYPKIIGMRQLDGNIWPEMIGGLTIRQEFAKASFQSILQKQNSPIQDEDIAYAATQAVFAAKMLIDELNKEME